ncbi:MAG TPA: hypothetical protein VKR83_07400 [Ktedonobacteraceae bacterium]|nr:hypothetical protein [Ktedonobacteraceae bacterium]
MGVERAVTRWYVQRQVLLYEIADLEERLRHFQAREQQTVNEEQMALLRQLAELREKLRLAGSCPKPMMG